MLQCMYMIPEPMESDVKSQLLHNLHVDNAQTCCSSNWKSILLNPRYSRFFGPFTHTNTNTRTYTQWVLISNTKSINHNVCTLLKYAFIPSLASLFKTAGNSVSFFESDTLYRHTITAGFHSRHLENTEFHHYKLYNTTT